MKDKKRRTMLRQLRECEVQREKSDINPWFIIVHAPTGKRLSAPPRPFHHPGLGRVTYYRPRRWRKASEAKSVIGEWRDLLGGEQKELALGTDGPSGDAVRRGRNDD